MKRKYFTIGTITKSNKKYKIAERYKIDTLTHKYMSAHYPGLVQGLRVSVFNATFNNS